MRVLVCGGRDFWDTAAVWTALDKLHEDKPIATVIQGGAPGTDCQAMTWAHSAGVECIEFKADWKAFGRSAGPLRNQAMIHEGKPDLVIAFPRANGEIGPGTADMVRRAKAAGIPVREVRPSRASVNGER